MLAVFSPQHLEAALALVREAGKAIMRIYAAGGGAIETKADSSPLTLADRAAHEVLAAGLPRLLDVPVLSEEGAATPWSQRRTWGTYWLVDPLDGTKEFLKRNGEFTVNVALVRDGLPVWGAVYAPALERMYYTGPAGAYRQDGLQPARRIAAARPPQGERPWRIVGSRSHQSDAFADFVSRYPGAEIVSLGSSLKLCMVADGSADLYPRLGPTSEWDTAAAHAVALAAGAEVVDADTLQPLRYNQKDSLLNPHFIVRPAQAQTPANVVFHTMKIDKQRRAARFSQKPAVIWFTGLSGSGKSTLADALEQHLFARGMQTYLLDGDNVRHGLCRDLGFSLADRAENIRRVGEAAKLMVDAGLIVLVSLVSPLKADRAVVRDLLAPGEFFEVHVNTPLAVCETRDPKGLYQKARRGEIKEFTGISSPYEVPDNPEAVVDTSLPIAACLTQLTRELERRGILSSPVWNIDA